MTIKFISCLSGHLVPALIAFTVLLSQPAFAQSEEEESEQPPEPFRTATPLDCPDSVACWIVDYVDRDRSRGALDYKCGLLTTDRHRSTDFAVGGNKAVREGVPVLASAGGVVIGVRSNMNDNFSRAQTKSKSGKQACGNGVLIEHQEGWTTQYCHLRKGSITVDKDQEVTQGQIIGMVGISGKTEFPHLSFTVRRDKAVVDPFVGPESSNECISGPQQLWKTPDDPVLSYRAAKVKRGGFSDIRPSEVGPPPLIEDRPAISRQIRALYLWADFESLRPRDEVWFRIFSPNGKQIFEHKTPINDHQFGKRIYVEFQRRRQLWPDGQYRGTMTLRRRQGGKVKEYALEHTVELR